MQSQRNEPAALATRLKGTTVARAVELAVILAAIATIPLTIAQQRQSNVWWLTLADWIVWSIFALEFVLLVGLADNRRVAARANWSSIAITIISFPLLPSLFALSRLARLARLARLFRLVRLALVASRGLHALRFLVGRHELLYVWGAAAFLIVVAAGVLTVVEPERGGFADGLWWAIVTTTTVGYGDISPTTVVGRVTAVVLMLVGIGIVATLAAAMASYFVSTTAPDDSDITARLERIEALLAELAERDRREGSDHAETS